MRHKAIAIGLVLCVIFGESASAVGQVAGAVTIPAGTVVPLTLVSAVKSKSTKVGDTVRAQVAFPVTVGSDLAIPAGTYVEGTLEAAAGKKVKGQSGDLQIHFTRLVYANGYTVQLDAMSSRAMLAPDAGGCVGVCGSEGPTSVGLGVGMLPVPTTIAGGFGFQAPVPSPAPLPPLPGPSTGIIVGIAVSAAAFVGVLLYLFLGARRARNSDYLAYDSGYQFSMKLVNAVAIDGVRASAAAASQP